MITYGSQKIFRNDFKILEKALTSNKLSQGEYCNSFEKKIKKIFKCKTCLLNK